MAATLEVADNATIELLVNYKLPLLSTVARAAMVDGLQKIGLRYRPQRQNWVKDIILQTHGLDLTHFKGYIDDGGDYHTMYKLVYNDLQGEAQKEVLLHLRREGEAVAAVVQNSGPGAPAGAVLKVLSDIDDTVFSSGDSFPAGVDSRYPRKCYYPGALALYAALDRCFAQRHAHVLQYVASVGVMAAADKEGIASEESEDEMASPTGQLGDSPPLSPLPGAAKGSKEEATTREAIALPPLPGKSAFALEREESQTSPFVPPLGQQIRALGPHDDETPRDLGTYFDAFSPRADSPPAGDRRLKSILEHHQEGSNLVFLSARPESYKGYTESESYRKYFYMPVARGELDTSPTMLLGSLDSGPRALMKLLAGKWLPPDDPNPKTAAAALYQTLAAKKLSRFREYASIYPEAAFVFVGDNGQGDVLCAEILYSTAAQAAKAAHGPRQTQLLASFIHRVVAPASTLSMLRSSKGTKSDWMAAWHQRRIYFHRSHVGMAVEAYNLGLLDEEALSLVATTANLDFRRILGRYGGRATGKNLGKAARHLNKDISAANARLPSDLRVPLVEAPGEASVPQDSARAPSVALSDITGLIPMQ